MSKFPLILASLDIWLDNSKTNFFANEQISYFSLLIFSNKRHLFKNLHMH